MTAHERLIELGKRKDKRWRAHNAALQSELARAWARWRKFADKCDAMGRQLMRQHVRGF